MVLAPSVMVTVHPRADIVVQALSMNRSSPLPVLYRSMATPTVLGGVTVYSPPGGRTGSRSTLTNRGTTTPTSRASQKSGSATTSARMTGM